jgi:hypothetical protein
MIRQGVTPDVRISARKSIRFLKQAISVSHGAPACPDYEGIPTYRAETFAEIISGIRGYERDLILVVSLSGRCFNEFEKRRQPLTLEGDLKPDMGSLTLSSVNFNRETSVNTPQMITDLAAEMQRFKILAELEVFDSGMINYAKYLEKKGLLQPPHYFNLIFGNIACARRIAANGSGTIGLAPGFNLSLGYRGIISGVNAAAIAAAEVCVLARRQYR